MTVIDHPSGPNARTAGPGTTRVAIVAASPVVRSGLAFVIAGVDGLQVGLQVDSITRLPPCTPGALIVLDLGGRPGAVHDEAFWQLAPRGTKIVALCHPDNPPNLIVALRAGVHALINREADTEDLVTAVRVAGQGGLHIAPDLFDTVTDTAHSRTDGRRQELTRREIEALKWVASGFTHGQISRRMGLTEATVSTYVKRIRHKLNVGNKAELTRRAVELGYVFRPDRADTFDD